jgi:hypothetical protein
VLVVSWRATGIGLARIGCLDLIADAEFIHEIEAALATTRDARPLSLDHLCCGNMGRINFLLTAGLRLGRPELAGVGRGLAALSGQGPPATPRQQSLPAAKRTADSLGSAGTTALILASSGALQRK